MNSAVEQLPPLIGIVRQQRSDDRREEREREDIERFAARAQLKHDLPSEIEIEENRLAALNEHHAQEKRHTGKEKSHPVRSPGPA